jgi:hypothetical protein
LIIFSFDSRPPPPLSHFLDPPLETPCLEACNLEEKNSFAACVSTLGENELLLSIGRSPSQYAEKPHIMMTKYIDSVNATMEGNENDSYRGGLPENLEFS